MSLLTYKEARDSGGLKNVLGVCRDGAAAKDYINRATRMLMNRGNFWGTVQMLAGCIYNDCITWNRYVGTVLAANTCGKALPVWNNWSGFVPIGPAGIKGEGFGYCNGICSGNIRVDNYGTASVFNQVPCGKNFYIRAYPSVRADVGKKITIFGIDSNGQVIRTKNADGIWQEGIQLTVAIPYTSTSIRIREIVRVVKDPTQGVLRLFQYDPDNDVLINCAAYDPAETSPDYRVSKIHGLSRRCCGPTCDPSVRQIKALVKLDFVPVENDNDLVLISNLDALGTMIQSVRNRDAAKTNLAREMELDAVRELNLELRDKFPIDQTPISINPFGTALPSHHRLGGVV